MFQPYLADYRYYAWFKDAFGMSDVANARGLYRSLGYYDEERYEGHGRWQQSHVLSRTRERDSDDDYREVTPAELENLMRRIDTEQPVRPLPPRIDFRGGGFAVFRHDADKADLRSAYAVVDELSPEHRFVLSLAPFERNPLAGAIALLAARRRAEPVDGHYYFAEFETLDDLVDVDRAHALLRCPASGDGKWEIYLQEGTWVLGKEPRDKHVLPVGREDVERISRGRETAEARYFDVWLGGTTDGGLYRHVLVRRTGSTDETVDDLGWQPTDVFERMEPTWWVLESGERGFSSSRRIAVMMKRTRGFGDRPHDYEAFFENADDVYDFSKVLFLAKRVPNPYELEYEVLTPDGWKFVSGLLRGTSLPISEEEFERLATPRTIERGAGDVRR